MRAVFFGSPEAALPPLNALRDGGHVVPLIVTGPDRPAGRGRKIIPGPVKRYALEHAIPVIQPERIRRDPEALEHLRAAAADIHVVVAYGQIIPRVIIDLPRHSTINVHFSLLPRHRGASPVAAAILAGDARTGVTIFRLNEKMDEGDLLAAAETGIEPAETAGELEARLAVLGADLLTRTLSGIDGIQPRPQDQARATLAPKLRKEDGRLDWTRTADEIDRRVRAMTPWPTAYTFLKGERLIVASGRPESEPSGLAGPAPAPGMILETSGKGILAACGGGTRYRITRVRPESRPPMYAGAFVLGGKAGPGDILEHPDHRDESPSPAER